MDLAPEFEIFSAVGHVGRVEGSFELATLIRCLVRTFWQSWDAIEKYGHESCFLEHHEELIYQNNLKRRGSGGTFEIEQKEMTAEV
jgi:hypothetical protein